MSPAGFVRRARGAIHLRPGRQERRPDANVAASGGMRWPGPARSEAAASIVRSGSPARWSAMVGARSSKREHHRAGGMARKRNLSYRGAVR